MFPLQARQQQALLVVHMETTAHVSAATIAANGKSLTTLAAAFGVDIAQELNVACSTTCAASQRSNNSTAASVYL